MANEEDLRLGQLLAQAAKLGILTPEQKQLYDRGIQIGMFPSATPVMKDIARSAPGALAKGLTTAASTPYALADLAEKLGSYGANKLGNATGLDEFFKRGLDAARLKTATPEEVAQYKKNAVVSLPNPTSENMMAGIEKATGKLPTAETGPGKVVESALQAAPSAVALGPASGAKLIPSLIKGAEVGAGSELGGQAVEASPWADTKVPIPGVGDLPLNTVGRIVGGFGGPGAVASGRRALTPNPVLNPSYRAAVDLADQYKLPMTAARRTGKQGLIDYEAGFNNAPAKELSEKEAFTKALMASTGSPAANPKVAAVPGGNNALLSQRNTMNTEYENFFNTHGLKFNPATMSADLGALGTRYQNAAGPQGSPAVKEAIDAVLGGVTPGPGHVSAGMTGPRYQFMRQYLNDKISNAGSDNERQALIGIKNKVEEALNNTLPPAQRDQLTDLNRRYENLKTLEATNIPAHGVLEPKDVVAGSKSQVGTARTNYDQTSEAGKLASAANTIYQPLVKPKGSVGAEAFVPAAVAGLATQYMTNNPELAGLYAILAGGTAASGKNMAKQAVSPIYHSNPVQAYLGNQAFPPSQATMADPALVAKILGAQGAQGALPSQ